MKGKIISVFRRVGGLSRGMGLAVWAAVFTVFVTVFGNTASAADFTMPDMPIDFSKVATAGVAVLGVVAGSLVGVFILVSLLNMGIKWARRAFTS